MIDEQLVSLGQIVRRVKDKFVYEYDFGDSWRHDVVVEEVLKPDPDAHYPICLAGRRHCPPEDVGGMWGYSQFLEAIADADHPEHDHYLAWIGGSFDASAFDVDEINRHLRRIR